MSGAFDDSASARLEETFYTTLDKAANAGAKAAFARMADVLLERAKHMQTLQETKPHPGINCHMEELDFFLRAVQREAHNFTPPPVPRPTLADVISDVPPPPESSH